MTNDEMMRHPTMVRHEPRRRLDWHKKEPKRNACHEKRRKPID